MQLTDVNRQAIEWIVRECFPLMKQMNEGRMRLYDNQEAEYWNSKIVGYVLDQVEKIFLKKLLTKSMFFKINLEPAEAVTLYRFLFNYPIPEEYRWKVIQRQFIIEQLYRQMNEPEKVYSNQL